MFPNLFAVIETLVPHLAVLPTYLCLSVPRALSTMHRDVIFLTAFVRFLYCPWRSTLILPALTQQFSVLNLGLTDRVERGTYGAWLDDSPPQRSSRQKSSVVSIARLPSTAPTQSTTCRCGQQRHERLLHAVAVVSWRIIRSCAKRRKEERTCTRCLKSRMCRQTIRFGRCSTHWNQQNSHLSTNGSGSNWHAWAVCSRIRPVWEHD